MMTFSLRFGGGIGRSVVVVLFDIFRSSFFSASFFALLVLFMPLLHGARVERGRRCARESSFVLASCWPSYVFFSFFSSFLFQLAKNIISVVEYGQEGEE